jgi:hypothetical protein
MFGTEYTRERIRDAAAKHFADNDDAAVAELWAKVITAFDQWKQEHGNRKPRANLGMLSDLVGPKQIPFKKAAPWQCADLLTPSPLALAYKLFGDKYPPFLAVAKEAGFNKVLALLIIGFADDTSDDDLFTTHEFLIEHATDKKWLTIEAVKEWKIRANLRKGPIEAAKKRTEKAAPRQATLDKAINDLFDTPEKPGWGMTNVGITAYLMKQGGYGYKKSTVRGRVNALAAEHREELRKKALAQCATK